MERNAREGGTRMGGKRLAAAVAAAVVIVLLIAAGRVVWGKGEGEVTLTRARAPGVKGIVFCVSNASPRAIFLFDQIVEVRGANGWWGLRHIAAAHPSRVAAGERKFLTIGTAGVPGLWRLRVAYGVEVTGPRLAWHKVAYAISAGKFPGRGWGMMAGSNSVIGVEMPGNGR